MRIGIDVGSILGDKGGVGWHVHHLLKSLVGLDEEYELMCYVPRGSLAGRDWEPWQRDRRLKWIETGRWLWKWRGRVDRLDLFHGPNFKLRTEGRCGGIVTVHDVWLDRHPEYSTKLFGQRAASHRTRRIVWKARKVVTVSDFSAREIADIHGLPQGRIVTIYNGVSEDFRPTHDDAAMKAFRDRHGIPESGFILFVGGADPRKNHRVLLQAAAQYRHKLGGRTLVLVGDADHRFGDYRRSARECGIEGSVRCVGRLSRAELQLLYSYADLFVFPSRYEGFGMPVLEAMACGAPTITSTTSALPEVAGDAALLVDPDDPKALGEAMVRLLHDAALRASLQEKGYARVGQFTWQSAARKTLALYRELTA